MSLFIKISLHHRFSSTMYLLEHVHRGLLPDLMKIKRLYPLMRVIQCDMSNYFVVRDPGSWQCNVRADPSAG